jgi:hypothetical protein
MLAYAYRLETHFSAARKVRARGLAVEIASASRCSTPGRPPAVAVSRTVGGRGLIVGA